MSTYLRSLPATDERRRQQCQLSKAHTSPRSTENPNINNITRRLLGLRGKTGSSSSFHSSDSYVSLCRCQASGKCVPPPTTHRDHLRASRFLGKSARIEERTGFFRTPSSSRKLASTKNERDVLFLLSIFATKGNQKNSECCDNKKFYYFQSATRIKLFYCRKILQILHDYEFSCLNINPFDLGVLLIGHVSHWI